MRKTLLAICLALAGLQAAAAQPPCYAARLRDSSGMFLSLTNGQHFQVIPGAGRTAVTAWLPQDRLQVCRGSGNSAQITNLSRPRRGTVTVLRQYNI